MNPSSLRQAQSRREFLFTAGRAIQSIARGTIHVGSRGVLRVAFLSFRGSNLLGEPLHLRFTLAGDDPETTLTCVGSCGATTIALQRTSGIADLSPQMVIDLFTHCFGQKPANRESLAVCS